MKRQEMLDLVRRELAHIPAGPIHQQLLRQAFWNMRLNSLSRKPQEPDDPLLVVNRAVSICMEQHPNVYYDYDKAFFEQESQRIADEKGGRPDPYEATLTLDLQAWARNVPADWMQRLEASLATIHQTIWERRPTVFQDPQRPGRVQVELDTYGFSQRDACHHAQSLLKRHLVEAAGLLERDYNLAVTSVKRGAPTSTAIGS
jgi:hypothetical protein